MYFILGTQELYIFITFLQQYLVDVFSDKRRGIFFLTNEQYVVFFCNDVPVQTIDDGQPPFGQLDDVIACVVDNNVRVDNHILFVTALGGFKYAVPCA